MSLKLKWPLAHNKPHSTEAYLGVIRTDLTVSKGLAFATSELDLGKEIAQYLLDPQCGIWPQGDECGQGLRTLEERGDWLVLMKSWQ